MAAPARPRRPSEDLRSSSLSPVGESTSSQLRAVPTPSLANQMAQFRSAFHQAPPSEAQAHSSPSSRRSSFADVASAKSTMLDAGYLLSKYHGQILELEQSELELQEGMDREISDADAALLQPLGPPPRLPSLRPLHGPSLRPMHAKADEAHRLMQQRKDAYEATWAPLANAVLRERDYQIKRDRMDSLIVTTRDAIGQAAGSCKLYDGAFDAYIIRLQQLEGDLSDLIVKKAKLLAKHAEAAKDCVELLTDRRNALRVAAEAQRAYMEAMRRYVTIREKLVRRGLRAWTQVLTIDVLLGTAYAQCLDRFMSHAPAHMGQNIARMHIYSELPVVFFLVPVVLWYLAAVDRVSSTLEAFFLAISFYIACRVFWSNWVQRHWDQCSRTGHISELLFLIGLISFWHGMQSLVVSYALLYAFHCLFINELTAVRVASNIGMCVTAAWIYYYW